MIVLTILRLNKEEIEEIAMSGIDLGNKNVTVKTERNLLKDVTISYLFYSSILVE